MASPANGEADFLCEARPMSSLHIGEAETVLRSCLMVREGKPPVDTLEVASVLVELSAVLREAAALEEAEATARRAHAIRDKLLGSQHPDTAIALMGKKEAYTNFCREIHEPKDTCAYPSNL